MTCLVLPVWSAWLTEFLIGCNLETNKPFGGKWTTLDLFHAERDSDSFTTKQTRVPGMDLLLLPIGPPLAPLFEGIERVCSTDMGFYTL